jgi:uncharacterized protein (TIGR03437 family)
MAVLFLAAGPAYAQFTASAGGPFATGAGPRSIVCGDFNGDGKLDVAVANSSGNSVTVLLGNGSGGFTAAAGSPFAVGNGPQSLVAGDFNGDGKLDLAIVNSADNTVSVMLGAGTGQFTAGPGSPLSVGAAPAFVATADFNGDNKADLIVVNSGDNTLSLLFGDGSGYFTAAPASPIVLSAAPQSVALGDVNRDGNQDVVIVNSPANSVTVLLGDGAGHFHAPAGGTVAVGSLPLAIALADMNGDGNLDIVVANSGDNTITELLGDGTGAFTVATGSPFNVGSKPSSLAVADFNGDGLPDVATANSANNNVTLLLGSSAGGFSAATSSPFAVGTYPSFIAIGDFNGDGKPDAAVANLTGNSVTLLLNSLPAITASPAFLSLYAVAGHPAAAAVAVTTSSRTSGGAYTVATSQPWLSSTPASNATGGVTTVNLSANPATLTAGVYSAVVRYKAANFFDASTSVTLSAANPTGTLAAAPRSPFSVGASPQAVIVADLNGDGKPDIVTANYAASTISVLSGDGVGGFTQVAGSPFATGASPAAVAAGDFNGDGKTDIVTANAVGNSISLFLGNNAGTFTASGTFPVGSEPLSVLVADVNRDGKLDVVTVNNSGNNVSVLLGNGSGGFAAAPGSPFAAGISPNFAAVGDFNGDGKRDLAVTTVGNMVLIFLGNGMGGYSYNGFVAVGSFPQSVAAQDVNGDGNVDLVTTNSGDNTVTVLLGNGSGGFAAASSSPFAVGTSPQFSAVGDVNGDGKPDILTANLGDNTVTILLGDGSGGFTPAAGSPFPAGTTPSALALGDFNGDGSPDLAIANAGGNAVTVLLGSPVATTSALTSTAVSPIAHGTSAMLTLTVTPAAGSFSGAAATGTATFLDGTTVLGNAKQAGSPYTFSAILGGGVHSLTATYNGDTANSGSTSGPLAITVLPQGQTITFEALPSKPFSAGSLTVAATASSGLPVMFSSSTPAVCLVAGALVSLTGAGVCSIQATQAGNADYASALPVTQTFQVMQATQSITFGSLPSVAAGSAPISLSATASSGLPVSYTSATTTVCTLAGSSVTPVTTGTCTISASQAGNTNYSAALPVSQSFKITVAGQTIFFNTIPDTSVGAPPFPVSATASSGLPISFSASPAAVCSVSGSTVTVAGSGNCTIKASQAGNNSYAAAAPVSQTFAVASASQSIAFASLADQTLGAKPFALSATASSGLVVTFSSTTVSVCTVGGVTVALVATGSCTIKAAQAGNTNYAAATPVTQTFNVKPQSQTIAFAALTDKVFGSPAFTVSAKATSNLAVAFVSNTSSVCTVSSSSKAITVTLVTAGTCTIEASQAGNASFAPATPVDQTFNVTQASQTITFAAMKNQVFGSQPITLTATASSGLPVTFLAGNSAICAVAGTTVTLLLGGTCTIQASQPGDGNYSAAASVNQSFLITPASQTIAFSTLPNQTLGSPPFGLSATASSGYPVSFASTTATVCTVFGYTVTLLATGTCKIQASQGGDANYAAAVSVVQAFTVTPGAAAVSAVLNAGSYDSHQIAAGSYAVAFGANFATVAAQATSTKLPATLGGVSMTITDASGATQPVDLFYVSASQVNFLVPAGIPSGSAIVTVTGAGGTKASAPINIAQVAPSLFTADATGKGAPAAIAQAYGSSGSPKLLTVFTCAGAPAVCSASPIDLGAANTTVFLELYGTGIRGRSKLAGVTATVNGVALNVTYAGQQGGYPGLDQVNLVLDRSLAGQGQQTLQLVVDGVPANPVVVNLK